MESDQNLSLPLLVSAGVLIATWLVIKLWKNRGLPPGPWGLPFLGYYPFLKETYKDFFSLSKTYGNVFSFRTVGGTVIIVLNGAKIIKEVLMSRADEFDGRPEENNMVSWLSRGLGITQEEGVEWSEQRKFFLQTIRNFGVGKLEMEERIHEEIRKMFSRFQELKSLKSVNMHLQVALANSNVISHVLFGEKLRIEKTFSEIIKQLNSLLSLFIGKINMIVGYSYDLLLRVFPSMRKYYKYREDVHSLTDNVVEKMIQSFDPAHERGYVDAYLQNMDSLRKKGMLKNSTFTKERLQAITMNLFLEGTESVSTAIVGLLTELSKHPDVQMKVQEELDNVIGRERLPSWLDRQKLPYVDATTQELFRVASPFLTTTFYSNFEETTIAGYRIPRRSLIIGNLYSIHFDPTEFPKPEVFDPTRFLNEEGKRIKREGPYPYGVGKRSCVGESLAQMEVFLILSAILQNYTLQPGDKDLHLTLQPRE